MLIHSAAGNVGRYAVQRAREAGLRVLGTASPQDGEAIFGLRADVVIGCDLATDEGRCRFRPCRWRHAGALVRLRARWRRAAIRRSEPDAALEAERSIRSAIILVDVRTTVLSRLSEFSDRGVLRICVGTIMPLGDAAEAHRMLDGLVPHMPGKIVLHVRQLLWTRCGCRKGGAVLIVEAQQRADSGRGTWR